MNPPATRHWLLIVEGDVEPFLIGPVHESDLLLKAREHRANALSAEDGLYAISLDAEGDLRIDAFAHAELEPEEDPFTS
jgi:hypothetical protein